MKTKVFIFAHTIYRLFDGTISWPEALVYSWDYFKNATIETAAIEIEKVDGTTSKRVVDFNWKNHYTPTGGGHPLKEGQILMVDLAKKEAGVRFLISTYKYKKIA